MIIPRISEQEFNLILMSEFYLKFLNFSLSKGINQCFFSTLVGGKTSSVKSGTLSPTPSSRSMSHSRYSIHAYLLIDKAQVNILSQCGEFTLLLLCVTVQLQVASW